MKSLNSPIIKVRNLAQIALPFAFLFLSDISKAEHVGPSISEPIFVAEVKPGNDQPVKLSIKFKHLSCGVTKFTSTLDRNGEQLKVTIEKKTYGTDCYLPATSEHLVLIDSDFNGDISEIVISNPISSIDESQDYSIDPWRNVFGE